MSKVPLQFRHNGRDVAIFVDGGTNLLVALRELIGDMTPKFGCGQGGCGNCTPGMLMAAKALLDRNPSPSRDEVVEAISGNICRCTGYEPIINAILAAAGGRASA